MLKNTQEQYGLVAKGFHAVMTVMIFFQLGWGMWMSELSYYDPQYHTAPAIHKAIGVLVLLMAMLRLTWRLIDPPPPYLPNLHQHEKRLAKVTMGLFYLLFMLVPISGYLVSTAHGAGIDMFGMFEIPALLPAEKGREDSAGEIHEFLAFSLLALIILHIAGALKHKIIDKDGTMKRMFGR